VEHGCTVIPESKKKHKVPMSSEGPLGPMNDGLEVESQGGGSFEKEWE